MFNKIIYLLLFLRLYKICFLNYYKSILKDVKIDNLVKTNNKKFYQPCNAKVTRPMVI